jgi:transposase
LLQQIALLTTQIAELDKQLEKLAKKYPEIEVLRTVPGVGPVVATAYVLTLDRPDAVAGNRAAGAYLGPRPPARLPVGDSDPQRRITRSGNTYLRSLLVQSRNTSWAASAPTLRCGAGA